MKKKRIAFIVGLLTLGIYFSIAFTMSSFDKNDPGGGNNAGCTDPPLTRSITLNFDSPNDANWARQPNFQGFVPSEDLRFGAIPALMLMIRNKWYAMVTVTSPQCPDFSFQYVLQTGSQVVSIQVPPADFEFHLEVVYWETYDAPYHNFDFNITPTYPGETNAGRLKHIFEYTFLAPWNQGVSQPIYLSPSHLVEDINPWGCADCGDSKPAGIEDYTDANDFITNRGN
ncbi:MAG: hypothetical protein CVU03_05880 [Bacteroidetes bacterium HGW-Bacteroidetes-2]|jgi:hypothetical protein|nr:MAG: hypothetical protein CVU03_05880 [Bacteroidetes bacterium HGW-Bacteroidetes-2]